MSPGSSRTRSQKRRRGSRAASRSRRVCRPRPARPSPPGAVDRIEVAARPRQHRVLRPGLAGRGDPRGDLLGLVQLVRRRTTRRPLPARRRPARAACAPRRRSLPRVDQRVRQVEDPFAGAKLVDSVAKRAPAKSSPNANMLWIVAPRRRRFPGRRRRPRRPPWRRRRRASRARAGRRPCPGTRRGRRSGIANAAARASGRVRRTSTARAIWSPKSGAPRSSLRAR